VNIGEEEEAIEVAVPVHPDNVPWTAPGPDPGPVPEQVPAEPEKVPA
jgi:hypothetical protein